jgi:hypothetical protein
MFFQMLEFIIYHKYYYDKYDKKILLLKKEVENVFIENKKLHQVIDTFQKDTNDLLTKQNKNTQKKIGKLQKDLHLYH